MGSSMVESLAGEDGLHQCGVLKTDTFMQGAASHNWEIPAEDLEPLMPWNVREEDLSIVTDEIDWLSRTMVPVQEWEECLAAEGDKR